MYAILQINAEKEKLPIYEIYDKCWGIDHFAHQRLRRTEWLSMSYVVDESRAHAKQQLNHILH